MKETQVELAAKGIITPQMTQLALSEGLPEELVQKRIAEGQIVLNHNRKSTLVGIGMGLATKINASIGTSTDIADIGAEVRKAVAAQYGDPNRLDLEKQGYRYGSRVSKGGASLISWMKTNGKENPLYEKFDRVVGILKKYDVVLSLGNGLRAGAIADSVDRAMIQELLINCELAEEGRKMGCQMIVEGPGHVPLDQIEANIILQKQMSNHAPYYMLGPLPTDVGAAYDHVVPAIGAAQSTRYGADLICYITPAEHLALPNEQDVIEGVKAARVGEVCAVPFFAGFAGPLGPKKTGCQS